MDSLVDPYFFSSAEILAFRSASVELCVGGIGGSGSERVVVVVVVVAVKIGSGAGADAGFGGERLMMGVDSGGAVEDA
ncbi:hypothetical protein Tco_0905676 [Tanacetum coccineum]